LLRGYDVALKATEVSQTSFGSAIEKNYKYMESLQAKITKLSASAQELAVILGNSGVQGIMSDTIGTITQFTQGLIEVISHYGKWTAGTIVLLASLILLQKRIASLKAEMVIFDGQLLATGGAETKLAAINSALTLSFNGLKVAVISTWTAFIESPLAPVILALTAISAATIMYMGSVKKAREEQEMLNKNLEEEVDKINQIKTDIKAGAVSEQDIFDIQGQVNKLDEYAKKVEDLQFKLGKKFNPTEGLSTEQKDMLSRLGIDISKMKTASQLMLEIENRIKELNGLLTTGKQTSPDYIEGVVKKYSILNDTLKRTNVSNKERSTGLEQLKGYEQELTNALGKELVTKIKEQGVNEDVLQSIEKLIFAKNEEAIKDVQAENLILTNKKDALQSKIDADNEEIKSLKRVAEQKQKNVNLSIWEVGLVGIKVAKEQAGKSNDAEIKAIQNRIKETQKIVDGMNKTIDQNNTAIDNYSRNHTTGGENIFGNTDDTSSSASKSAKETLEAWESVYDQLRTDYQNTAAILSRKIDLGVVSGLEVLEEKLNLEEDKLNNIFGARTQLTEDLASWKQKLTELDTSEHDEDYLRQRENILTVIKQITAELETQNQKEEWQVKLVNQLKKEYEPIEAMMSKFNSLSESALSNMETIGQSINDLIKNDLYSLDLNKFFDDDIFGNATDMVSGLKDSLKELILDEVEGIERIRDLRDAVLAKIHADPNAPDVDDYIEQLKEYNTKLTDQNNINFLDSAQDSLQEIIDYENSLAKQKQIITDTISSYQEELDTLEEQEEEEDRLKEIEEAKLAIQEKEVALQEKINELKKIENEIEEVKQDERYEFITAQGQRILTYDTAKVSELEEDKTSAQTDVDEAGQEVLDAKQALKDKELEIAREKEKELLQLQIDAAQAKLDQYDENNAQEMEQFVQNWISKHQADLNYFNDIANIYATGYNEELKLYKSYWKEQQDLYAKSIKDAYEAGSRISAAFSAGKNGNSMPSTSFSAMSYNSLESTTIDIPMPSTTTINNQAYVALTKSDSDKVMSIINSYASLSLASNS